jgi:N-acetylmuramate 1-kinase
MTPPGKTLAEPLCTWLSGWLAKERLPTDFRVASLAGDGSPRPFFRIDVPGKSFVLLHEPQWTLSKDYAKHQAYLEGQGVPVPAFFALDETLGVLLMEDLGDTLLQVRLLEKPEEKKPWLENAIRLLARLHGSTFPVPTDLPVAGRRFDAAKYRQEFDYTFECLGKEYLGLGGLAPEEDRSVTAFCKTIASFGPDVFCHRDYHTRNLLVFREELRLIDFQDARLGPIEYDLASFLFDPYVGLDENERLGLLSHYHKVLSAFPLSKQIDWNALPQRLRQVAYQRVVKAAGSFASFYTRQGKSTHLPYLVPALESALRLQRELGAELPSLPLEVWLNKVKEKLA